MPDLITHALTGHILHRASDGKMDYSLLMAGSLLPDVVSWLPMNVYIRAEGWLGLPHAWERWFPPMHSPLLVLLWCVLLALLFAERWRGLAFWSLGVASQTHILLDLMQLKYDGGYLVFYPVCLERHQIGLIPQDEWGVWILLAAVGAAVAEVWYRRRRAGT